MRTSGQVLVIFFLAMGGVSVAETVRDSLFQELMTGLKSGSLNIDFTELRMAFANSSFFNPYMAYSDLETSMKKAYQNDEFSDALQYAGQILEDNYLNVDAHVMCYSAYIDLGEKESADFHGAIADGLIQSIIGSGDGKSPETAYLVISVTEEYDLLDILGVRVLSQSLLDLDGHYYDVLEVDDLETGEKQTLYFNVDIPLTWLSIHLDE